MDHRLLVLGLIERQVGSVFFQSLAESSNISVTKDSKYTRDQALPISIPIRILML
jgi:hypothetical protein